MSYVCCRADEWDINKWAWEGVLKVVSKGESCSIRLEDKDTGEVTYSVLHSLLEMRPGSWAFLFSRRTSRKLKRQEIDCATGDLYAQAPIRQEQPLPVEAVIDSSRYYY